MSSSEVESLGQQLSEATVETGKKLSYAGKGLKLNSEEDAKEIEREIAEFKDLEILCLEGNTVGVDAAKAIARGLQNHPEFQRALWSDMFTGRMKTEIPPALKYLSEAMMVSGVKLVELDLSDNAFGPNGIKGVEDLLRSETCFTLEVLKLNNNGLGPSGGKILSSCLDDCYEASLTTGKPMGLKVFVSGRGRLENEGAKNLSAVFKKMGSLEFVAMPQNGIQYAGITELAAAFAQNRKLKHLNLNDNTFTVKGAKAMAEALKEMHGLEVINFGDCLIRTDGALLLAEALKEGHTNLKELILCGNEIQKNGGLAIANSLVNKENMTKIELGANNFGEEGVEEVKSILEPLGEILDEMDDDDGSEVEDDDDAAESGEERGASDKDDEVEVLKTDLTNIIEDPSVTKSESSAGSLDVDSVASPNKGAVDDVIQEGSPSLPCESVTPSQSPITSETERTIDSPGAEESEISEIREISVSMTEYDADISGAVANGQISDDNLLTDESLVIANPATEASPVVADPEIVDESDKIAAEIVHNALEQAVAQVAAQQKTAVLETPVRNSESPLKDTNSGKKSTPKRRSLSSLISRKSGKSKENSVSELTSKLDEVHLDSDVGSPSKDSPSKRAVRNEKDCLIL